PQRHPSQEGNLGRSINNRLGISETISSRLENLREKTRFFPISSTERKGKGDRQKGDFSHVKRKGDRQEGEGDFTHTSNLSYMSHSVLEFIRPFDLSQAPLLRVALLKIEKEKHILMVDMHHIISDGISMELLLHDFAALLADRELPPLNVSYKDYTVWQHTRAGRDMMMNQAAFWEQAFAGEIPVLELPTDYTRPAVQDFEGQTMEFQLTGEETRALNRFSLEQQSTLFMTLLAIYALFLSKITDQQDIVVGTPVSGRRSPDIDLLVGLFVNTLALRNYVHGERTFAAFLAEVKESTLQAFENQDYPYEDLIEKLIIKRDISRNPLFDSMFVLQGAEIWEMEIPGLKRSPFSYDRRTSKFDLTLQAQHIAGKLAMSFEYCTKLFKPGTIERFINYFKKIVRSVLKNPNKNISGLEILPGNERKRILEEFNHPLMEYPAKTVVDLFAEQAARLPDQNACFDKGNYLTFDELDNQADVLAKIIKEL
ncbi:MAG: hypothetical protein KAW12_02235, partial [Candidatus Aminicenantes bacterium]|nr:hypothetical protein [Candidatus Aminicenantes bacterium]